MKSKFSDKFMMDDVEGVIQLCKNDVLVAVINGEINLNEVALTGGLDKNGKWVGFKGF